MASLKRKHESGNTYHISTEWIIREDKINNFKESQTLSDKRRNVPGLDSVKHYLKLYPKFNQKTRLYLYLEMEEKMDLLVNARISIKSANFFDYWIYGFKQSDMSGSSICLTTDFFDQKKKFFVDGKIRISFEATITIMDVNNFSCKKSKDVNFLGPQLWENESGKDGKIVVEGEEITVHKVVLQCRSNMFKCKVEPGTSKTTAKSNTIFIKNYEAKIVKTAVNFCYDLHQDLDNLSDADAVQLLKFAEEFAIPELKDSIEEVCIKLLSPSNACLMANVSVAAKADKLLQSCKKFMLKCMKDGTTVKDIDKLNDGMQKELFVKSLKPS